LTKILGTALALLVLAAPVCAESSGSIGVKGGLNLFSLCGDDVEEAAYRTGFAIGAAYAHRFSELFALQPELYYTVKGAKNEEDEDVKLREGYIEIPVLFRVSLPVESARWSPGIYAGPYLAFLMTADLAGEGVKDEYRDVDYGLVAGASFDFPLSGGLQQLNLDFRYSAGFAKIEELQILKIYNHGFQFLVGYTFSL
jgi:hypothetical protein